MPIFAFGQDLDCERFRTGKFVLKNSTTDFESLIIRNDSLQMEFVEGPEPKAVFSVTWLSECAYDLNVVSGPDQLIEFYSEIALHVKIVETFESSYKFEAMFDGGPVMTEIMHKIE